MPNDDPNSQNIGLGHQDNPNQNPQQNYPGQNQYPGNPNGSNPYGQPNGAGPYGNPNNAYQGGPGGQGGQLAGQGPPQNQQVESFIFCFWLIFSCYTH